MAKVTLIRPDPSLRDPAETGRPRHQPDCNAPDGMYPPCAAQHDAIQRIGGVTMSDLVDWAFASVLFSIAFAIITGVLLFAYTMLTHVGAPG